MEKNYISWEEKKTPHNHWRRERTTGRIRRREVSAQRTGSESRKKGKKGKEINRFPFGPIQGRWIIIIIIIISASHLIMWEDQNGVLISMIDLISDVQRSTSSSIHIRLSNLPSLSVSVLVLDASDDGVEIHSPPGPWSRSPSSGLGLTRTLPKRDRSSRPGKKKFSKKYSKIHQI